MLVLEFGAKLYLIPTSHNVLEESVLETAADWSVSRGRHFKANIIIRGMHKHYYAVEVGTILEDIDLKN